MSTNLDKAKQTTPQTAQRGNDIQTGDIGGTRFTQIAPELQDAFITIERLLDNPNFNLQIRGCINQFQTGLVNTVDFDGLLSEID